MSRLVLMALSLCLASPLLADTPTDPVAEALARAGENRAEMEKSLSDVPDAQRRGLVFLLTHMPERDLRSLTAEFLLENVDYAYRAWQGAPWKDSIPEEIFLNDILPYASINERRDRWRKDFYERFRPHVENARSAAHAAALLNQKIFPEVGVKYSTKRPKPDQSPYESIEAGTASCTGLSILLIDACRAVGVPARFVGTPRWSDGSGNHSWVEVWDGKWHFTGAAEPTGEELNRSWFLGRAAQALRDDRMKAIYATSYRKTPQTFPLLWARNADYVHAVNVTDRYTTLGTKLPDGKVYVRFRVRGGDHERLAVPLKVTSSNTVIFEGTTNDERFDANDHLSVVLDEGESYEAIVKIRDEVVKKEFRAAPEQLISFHHGATPSPVQKLEAYLSTDRDQRPALASLPFASTPLTRAEADQVRELLWRDHVEFVRQDRAAEMKAKVLRHGQFEMPFHYEIYGDKPADGRSLYISLHGGGGAPKRVNDQQWQNQKRLYRPDEGVYVAPRAPTDTWNLWHQAHIDPLFDRLIETLIVFEDVNPDRVYVMGYSAGGDGVYQIAPRMADRWAAAAMMAGHPNEASPLGLRNIGFALQVGGRDSAYQRNEVARTWEKKLAELRQADAQGYEHFVKIYPTKGHWMDREDAVAVPWMAKFRRDLRARKVVWYQDDVCQSRYYWLAVTKDQRIAGSQINATLAEQRIDITGSGPRTLLVRLDDDMLNLDRDVKVTAGERTLFEGRAIRSIDVLDRTLRERGDPRGAFSTEIEVPLARVARF